MKICAAIVSVMLFSAMMLDMLLPAPPEHPALDTAKAPGGDGGPSNTPQRSVYDLATQLPEAADIPEVTQAPETAQIPEAVKTPEAARQAEEDEEYIAYLTFDDGPSRNTMALLDKLDALDVKATFFVAGNRIHKYPAPAQEIIKRGHVLGLHSYSHEYDKIYKTTDAFAADLEAAEKAMPDDYQKIYRFPGGIKRAKKMAPELAAVLKEKGYTYYEWDADVGDGEMRKPPVEFLSKCWRASYAKQKKPHRLIILLHDLSGKKSSIAFLDTLVAQLKAEGYSFATLS